MSAMLQAGTGPKGIEMKNVRELVGSLTQARVQMMAAQAIIEKAENTCADEVETSALELDVRKLQRVLGVVNDVRERYARPNESVSLPERAEGPFNMVHGRQQAAHGGSTEDKS